MYYLAFYFNELTLTSSFFSLSSNYFNCFYMLFLTFSLSNFLSRSDSYFFSAGFGSGLDSPPPNNLVKKLILFFKIL